MTQLPRKHINDMCTDMAGLDWSWGKIEANFRYLARQHGVPVSRVRYIYYYYFLKQAPATMQEATKFTQAEITIEDGELHIGEAKITGNFKVVLH